MINTWIAPIFDLFFFWLSNFFKFTFLWFINFYDLWIYIFMSLWIITNLHLRINTKLYLWLILNYLNIFIYYFLNIHITLPFNINQAFFIYNDIAFFLYNFNLWINKIFKLNLWLVLNLYDLILKNNRITTELPKILLIDFHYICVTHRNVYHYRFLYLPKTFFLFTLRTLSSWLFFINKNWQKQS